MRSTARVGLGLQPEGSGGSGVHSAVPGRRRDWTGTGAGGEPLALPSPGRPGRVNHPGLRSVRGGAQRVELSRDLRRQNGRARGEGAGVGGACVGALPQETCRDVAWPAHGLRLLSGQRRGRPRGEAGGGGLGAVLTAVVYLPAENMAAQREWTPMVSSRATGMRLLITLMI